jgi:hypothetical protein
LIKKAVHKFSFPTRLYAEGQGSAFCWISGIILTTFHWDSEAECDSDISLAPHDLPRVVSEMDIQAEGAQDD